MNCFCCVVMLILLPNKMNQEPSCLQDEFEYFSRPEMLEEMRANLLALINQDANDVDALIHSLRQQFPIASCEQEDDERLIYLSSRFAEVMETVTQELRQRSASLTSVGTLSVKMIDFITEQSSNYYHCLESYQLEIDRLQNTIDDLSSKNTLIQSDVEIFKDQLESARNELDEIAEEKEENAQEAEQNSKLLLSLKDSKIENLLCELQKMKTQVNYYKASGLSRTSFKNFQRNLTGISNIHTKSLLALNEKSGNRVSVMIDVDNEEDIAGKYAQKNRELEEENEKLRMEIQRYRLGKSEWRKEQKEIGSTLMNSEIEEAAIAHSKPLLRVKTSSRYINTNHAQPPAFSFDFTQFLNLFKSKREERLVKMTQPPQSESSQRASNQNEDLEVVQVEPRHLSSEWSKSSLPIFNPQAYQPLELVYLTQQSQECNDQEYNVDFQNSNPTKFSDNKQTEASLKAEQGGSMQIKLNMRKSYESVGINTLRQTSRQQEPNIEQPHPNDEMLGSRIMKKLTSNSLLDGLKGFIVNKRIKRKSKNANSGTSLILI